MNAQKLLGMHASAARRVLNCSLANPVHAVCCGPADPLNVDSEWMLHIHVHEEAKTEALEAVQRELETLHAPSQIISTARFSLIPPSEKVSRLAGAVGPETQIKPTQDALTHGTLGMLVSKGNECPYLLTCNHVIQDAKFVFTADDQQIALDAQPAADFDAAIAKLKPGVAYDPSFPASLGRVTLPAQNPSVGMEVVQAGAESGTAVFGTITCWPCAACVFDGSDLSYFSDVAVIAKSSFAQHGDSGSIVIDKASGAPVGILFACASEDSDACVGPVLMAALPAVLASLGVTPILTPCP